MAEEVSIKSERGNASQFEYTYETECEDDVLLDEAIVKIELDILE